MGYAKCGNKCLPVRVFFDTGSQLNFVHPQLVTNLNTPIIYTRITRLQSFTECTDSQTLSFVKISLTLGVSKSTILCAIHPGTQTTFYAEGLSNCASYLREHNFTLADSYKSDLVDEIQVIIGACSYHRFIYGTFHFEGIDLLKSSAGLSIVGNIPANFNPDHTPMPPIHELMIDSVITYNDELPLLWKTEMLGIVDSEFTDVEQDV